MSVERGKPNLVVAVLLVACIATALALVYTKHESRKLFVELESLNGTRDELNIEWGQLQIEQSTWAAHPRIEQVATGELALIKPAADAVYVIERQ